METQLALMETKPDASPLAMVQMAVAQGADIAVIERLMGLAERWQANQAAMKFNEAFSAFKGDAVRIAKNVTVTDGPLKGKKYADLFSVVDALGPALSKYDLSHSWKLTKDEPQWMEVTCTLRHKDGHCETVSMAAAPDTGPGRNAIQARASALSYLERYTFLAVTGTAAAGEDKDGNMPKAEGTKMPDADLLEWLDGINQAPNMEALKQTFANAYKAAEALNDKDAMAQMTAAKNAAKKALQ